MILIKEINNADLWLSADEAISHRFADIKMGVGKALQSLDKIYDDYIIRKGQFEQGTLKDFPFDNREGK